MSEPTRGRRAYNRSRQKFTIFSLATFLIIAGLLLVFVLKRVPLPMRVFAGLGDLVAGAALLVLGRQKFVEK
jgi:hypothetical protein